MASHYAQHQAPRKCYYQILRVSQTASTPEIKASYRALALKLHPDQHGGCPNKQAEFQQLNQAYQVLANDQERHAYDMSSGILNGSNNSRRFRAGVNPHYRKVYAPRPPPEWKFVWDHEHHQEMHYGAGMQRQAIRMAVRDAKKAGAFDYQSPLGRGFSFHDPNDEEPAGSDGPGAPPLNRNPFSKHSPQGPPTVTFEYEEGGTNLQGDGKARLHRKERIVYDMFQRRSERRRQQQAAENSESSTASSSVRPQQQQPYSQYQRFQQRYTHYDSTASTEAVPETNSRQPQEDQCVIL